MRAPRAAGGKQPSAAAAGRRMAGAPDAGEQVGPVWCKQACLTRTEALTPE